MNSPAVEPADKVKDEDTDCRLRNALNPDCLAEIFKYLDQYDLLTLSKMNLHYKEIIVDRIISFIDVNLNESNDQSKRLMAEFGATIKSIKFKGDKNAFRFLMQFINDYCNINQLQKIDITARRDERIDNYNFFHPELVNSIKLHFQNFTFGCNR